MVIYTAEPSCPKNHTDFGYGMKHMVIPFFSWLTPPVSEDLAGKLLLSLTSRLGACLRCLCRPLYSPCSKIHFNVLLFLFFSQINYKLQEAAICVVHSCIHTASTSLCPWQIDGKYSLNKWMLTHFFPLQVNVWDRKRTCNYHHLTDMQKRPKIVRCWNLRIITF